MPLTNVAGRKVYYEIHGDPSPVPLLLLMGMAGSCRGWLGLQVPEFKQHRRTVIFENRGVGASEDPGGPFTTADMADDAVGLLRALGIERADVLGAFMGGMIAQEMALRHPESVERLVLVGTYARPDVKRRMLLEKWKDMVREGVSSGVLSRERLLWTLQDETFEQRDLVEAMVEYLDRSGAPVSDDLLARQCEACLQHDTLDRLAAIQHTTLIVCGRQDQLTPPRLHRELADGLPNARLVTFSYGAHLVVVESAQRFNHLVLQFLAEDR
jgi:pimeloyl-ACP methyl ester carboxylesterase